jgi:putative transposase
MQIELLNRKNWTTVLELSTATTEWICGLLQSHPAPQRPGYLTPDEYEAVHSEQNRAAFP